MSIYGVGSGGFFFVMLQHVSRCWVCGCTAERVTEALVREDYEAARDVQRGFCPDLWHFAGVFSQCADHEGLDPREAVNQAQGGLLRRYGVSGIRARGQGDAVVALGQVLGDPA